MPSYNHRNPSFDSLNQGIGAITQALYNAPALRRQAEQAEFQNRLMQAQQNTQEALAGKYGAETTGLKTRNAAMLNMPIEVQAAEHSTPDNIVKALFQLQQLDGYKAAAADPSKVGNFGRLQAAADGKAIYDMNNHNVTIDKFTGAVGNEQNPLNQSVVQYGNDGSVVGKAHAGLYGAQATTEKSKQAENFANARQHDASARNYDALAGYNSNRATAEKTTESFAGYDADGNEIYNIVPKASGGTVTKRNTLNDKNANMGVESQTKEIAAIQTLTDQLFGVRRNKKTGDVLGNAVPLDGESMSAITNEAVSIRRASDNKVSLSEAVQQAVNKLTGGQGTSGLEDVGGGWFSDPSSRKLKKPTTKAQPKAKPAATPAATPAAQTPYGNLSDEELLMRLNGNV